MAMFSRKRLFRPFSSFVQNCWMANGGDGAVNGSYHFHNHFRPFLLYSGGRRSSRCFRARVVLGGGEQAQGLCALYKDSTRKAAHINEARTDRRTDKRTSSYLSRMDSDCDCDVNVIIFDHLLSLLCCFLHFQSQLTDAASVVLQRFRHPTHHHVLVTDRLYLVHLWVITTVIDGWYNCLLN